MKDKRKKKELNKIKQRVDTADSIRYLIGQALFEEDAGPDIKFLIAEIERCWEEIEGLNESLKLLTQKTIGSKEAEKNNSA